MDTDDVYNRFNMQTYIIVMKEEKINILILIHMHRYRTHPKEVLYALTWLEFCCGVWQIRERLE